MRTLAPLIIAFSISLPAPGQMLQPGDLVASDALALIREMPPDPAGAAIRVDPDTGAQERLYDAPRLQIPFGIAIDPQQRLLLTEIGYLGGDTRVLRFDPGSGESEALCTDGVLSSPTGVEVIPSGDILVANPSLGLIFGDGGSGVSSIVRCERDGSSTVVTQGQRLGPDGPGFLAVEPEGTLLVTDPEELGGSGEVIRVDPNASPGSNQSALARGPLVDPTGIAFDPVCGAYVVDTVGIGGTGRIYRLDRTTGSLTALCQGAPLVDPVGAAIERERGCSVVVANFDLEALYQALEAEDPLAAILAVPRSLVRCDTATNAMQVVTQDGELVLPLDVMVVAEPGSLASGLAALCALAAIRRRCPLAPRGQDKKPRKRRA